MKDYNDWEEIGEIGIYTGVCWMGDPRYCITPDANDRPAQTWDEFCSKLLGGDYCEHEGYKQWNYKSGVPGLGVSVSTGYGDGCYPVYIQQNKEGRIAAVKVVFIPEDEDREDER